MVSQPSPYHSSFSPAPSRIPSLAPSLFSHSTSVATPEIVNDAVWYPDSGASSHVTPEYNNLMHASPYHGADQLHIGNGQGLCISHIGCSNVIPSSSSPHLLHLNNLLYVPSITKNLVSVSKFSRDNSVFFEFHPYSYFVKS